ncbi:MAG: YihA family ribosome biogenesis GTP-binding protein [Bacteroidales bacterium]|jgi:GTP-binding protein|nr:YihA family ribosome biogenesis GTP-binding protein [Bacteroidales bacterium]
MKITQAKFVASCTSIADKPKLTLPEFAFIGRSNVGKSSLINTLSGNKSLAHISSTPGKTLCINHFIINDSWYLVDLPGYGFAKVSKTTRNSLKKMINDYVLGSPQMVLLFVLLDGRHDILKNDLEFLQMLGNEGVPFSIVFTKCDKLGVNALAAQVENNKQTLMEYWEELPPVFISSSQTGKGKDEILDYIDNILKTINNS